MQLKPLCLELIQTIASLPQRPNAKRDVTQALTKILNSLQEIATKPDILDAKIADFVFVPLSHVLRVSRNVPVHALELCLDCISILLTSGWKDDLSPELTGQLLILFTFLANPSSAENGLSATSEELQAASLKCMTELIAKASRNIHGKQSLTKTENIPTLGKAVLTTVDSLAEAPSNEVKFHALAAIQAFSSGIDDLDALASFLPRMASSLTKVLTPSSSNRVNFRVLERGLNTLSLLLVRVLGDRVTSNLAPQAAQAKAQDGAKVLRTASWLQATAAQIKIALANVLKLRNHDKTEVRQALLQLCLSVIQDCRASLSECTGMMVETLVTLAGRGGENDSVEQDLKVLLSTESQIAGLLRESLHSWVLSLPRLMQSKDDNGRHQIIHKISVTFRLLNGEQMELSSIDDLLAMNLRDSVSHILSDSKGAAPLIESTSDAPLESALVVEKSRSISFPPLRLPFKSQDDALAEFKLLLYELSRSNSALNVTRDLISMIESGNQETQLATFWLAVNLLKDTIQYNTAVEDFLDFGMPSLQTQLLDELYSLSLTKLTQSEDSGPHWQTRALSLEVVALQAYRYKEDFRVELIEALYPVLYLLGSSSPALREHAITCLNMIASSCGYASASHLIVSNVDYLVNAVGLKLNYHDVSPQAAQVLLMMMRLCGPSLLPYLDDLVASMFSALERYHGYPKLVELLFSVLRGMAEEGVKTPQLAIEADDQRKHRQTWRSISISEVAGALKKNKLESRKGDEEHRESLGSFPRRPWKDSTSESPDNQSPTEESTREEDAVQPTEPPPPAPRTFDILLKISELTQHYLTSSSPNLRTSLLSLLHTTIPALSRHENSFLPLVNTLWPVLLPRLEDPEAYVVSDTLDIMALMCTYAGNFMKNRIEGIWEVLKALHQRTTKQFSASGGSSNPIPKNLVISHKHEGGSVIPTKGSDVDHFRPEKYVDAPARMTREALIRLLSAVAQYVVVQEDFFENMVDMLDLVLGREDVRQALESRNSDVVWLRLFRKSKQQAGPKGSESTHSAKSTLITGEVPTGKHHWKFVRLRL